MAQQVSAVTTKPDVLSSIFETQWWKDRTDHVKLSFNLHMHVVVSLYIVDAKRGIINIMVILHSSK